MTNYLNLQIDPEPGQTWAFRDNAIENKVVEWKVFKMDESLDGSPLVEIHKMTGQDVGYITKITPQRFRSKKWEFVDGPMNHHKVLWNCPECNSDQPILAGDYVCQQCRIKSLTEDIA